MNAETPVVTRTRWIILVGWLLVLLKCVFVTWAIRRWAVPFHPGWLVGPTLAFAALATALWWPHRDEADPS